MRGPAASGRRLFRRNVVTKLRTLGSLGAVALAAVSVAACGSSERVLGSAPSGTAVTASAAALASLLPREATATPVAVTSVVSGTSCPTLQFMISTYTFKVSASTQYTGGACANIQVGARITFTGTRDSESSQVFNV